MMKKAIVIGISSAIGKVVSIDAKSIVENGKDIPGIEQWWSASAYYLAQKV